MNKIFQEDMRRSGKGIPVEGVAVAIDGKREEAGWMEKNAERSRGWRFLNHLAQVNFSLFGDLSQFLYGLPLDLTNPLTGYAKAFPY